VAGHERMRWSQAAGLRLLVSQLR